MMKMNVLSMKNNNVIFFWWFGMIVKFCFLLCACSQNTSLRGGLKKINNLGSTVVVKLNTENKQQLVVDNGIVSVTLSKPEGYLIGISYNGIDNILESEYKEHARGYFDVVWNELGKHGKVQRIHGTKFSVIVANENMVEVSFLRSWTSSMTGIDVPINIDIRYIFRRGDSGFYSYAIFDRHEGMPAVKVDQIRFVFRLNKDRFNYMALSDTRQRRMPTMRDVKTGQVLAYPEAVLLTKPHNPQFTGEVDDKYQYSCENINNTVHGWISLDSDPTVGFWMITPSNEFRNGGPIKQDLTSHAGPITLSMFVSPHYAGKDVTMEFEEGETYKKVFGPIFVYLNTASSENDNATLWSDAVQQFSKEVQSWPYDFPQSKDYFPPNQRGAVFGRLLVQDWYFKGGRFQYTNNAYVGLALPGDAGSWQTESKGYQFWTRANAKGYFKITNAVPGDYNLYAWVPGFIGDYKYNATITITPGGVIKLNSLVYNPPRNGPTIWEIGIPDRLASEFHIPDPYPTLMNKLYTKKHSDKFRQYGLWKRYSDIYPNDDLVYTVGVNNYRDWFFAHVTRSTGNKTYEPTTWQIIFEHKNDIISGNYTLQLALASAADSNLQVRFNDRSKDPPHFATGRIGRDNAIARHGIHGLYRLFSINVSSNLLVKGKNIIYLRQSKADTPFQGVMYDYIRLERPPAI
ncbi:probable rhamnogalacturonate lyase B isoform X1 [Medicago truncatula]|nr:probable rhamnogalacturonate lyase B isoform X1 [Medicago truncatula]AET03356.2 rhamnogalacturonate lyase B-like protein [Medicago truncatula]